MAGIGYGKVILFGEHFVVYGKPAIVAGLRKLKKVVEIKEGKWNREFSDSAVRALKRVASKCGCPKKASFNLKISGNIPIKQNLGSSAALCVAFARAINSKYRLKMKDTEINLAAYEGEKEFHGNPSGIDTSAATYGGLFSFYKKENGAFNISPISITGMPFHLLISGTGEKKLGTGAMVALFREIKEKDPDEAERAFKAYSSLYVDAIEAIESHDAMRIGALMDLNHRILVQFKLSTPEIDHATLIMKETGSLGCKITGAGGGGNIIGLFKSHNKAKRAQKVLEKEGFPTLYARIE
jgi:mevalonate kinase